MTNFRENLIDRMIRLYGFENPMVIEFCRMCEDWENNQWNDKVLRILVEAHEANPVFDEDCIADF